MCQFILSTNANDFIFFIHFLSMWFGEGIKIADISESGFKRAFNACMRPVEAKESNNGRYS